MRDNTVTQAIPSHLHWACRRGMLELDVLLGNFLEEAYTELSSEDQSHFVNLLNCNDQELFRWLMGKEVATNTALANIVEKVRNHAKLRKQASSI